MNGRARPAVRLVHFSDVHVTAPVSAWQLSDWFNKRLPAWLNLRLLGRGSRFRHTDRVLSALAEDLRQRNLDRIVFSGDATALGFQEEVERAASLLGVGSTDLPPGLAVPGNHDYMIGHAVSGGHYERHFAPWQQGERVDDATYPFAQRVGQAWLIAVNSARVNRWAWDASGGVGSEQLSRLERLLAQLEGGPRILVTHYPVHLADGRPERRSHGLHDLDDLVGVGRRGGIGLWLHGHQHHDYYLPATEKVPFPVICAGSVTQRHVWSYKDYTLTDHHLTVVTRSFDSESNRFRDRESFEMELPGSPAATPRPGSNADSSVGGR